MQYPTSKSSRDENKQESHPSMSSLIWKRGEHNNEPGDPQMVQSLTESSQGLCAPANVGEYLYFQKPSQCVSSSANRDIINHFTTAYVVLKKSEPLQKVIAKHITCRHLKFQSHCWCLPIDIRPRSHYCYHYPHVQQSWSSSRSHWCQVYGMTVGCYWPHLSLLLPALICNNIHYTQYSSRYTQFASSLVHDSYNVYVSLEV